MTLEQLYDTAFAGLIPRCCHGHLLTPGNTYRLKRPLKNGWHDQRRCLTCQRLAHQRWMASKSPAHDRRAYAREWQRERRALEYLHRAIRDTGREIVEAVGLE